MAFPRRLLLQGEEVVVEVRPHWSFLGRSLPATVSALALVVAVAAAWPSAPVAIGDATLVVLGVALLWLAGRSIRWRTTSIVVTTARIVQRSGVVARRGLDIRLERINEISYHQSIVGRIAGTGQLLVEVGGESGLVVFDHVRRPGALAGVVQEEISALGGRGAGGGGRGGGGGAAPAWHSDDGRSRRPAEDTPPAGVWATGRGVGRGSGDVAQPSVAQQLIELDELRRRGIVSEEEFARKKAELLDRL